MQVSLSPAPLFLLGAFLRSLPVGHRPVRMSLPVLIHSHLSGGVPTASQAGHSVSGAFCSAEEMAVD